MVRPLDLYFRVDNHVFIGPYLYGKTSQQTITYEFGKGGNGYTYYTKYFEDLWNGIGTELQFREYKKCKHK